MQGKEYKTAVLVTENGYTKLSNIELEIINIEHQIACNELTAAQVFTKMKQLMQAIQRENK